MTDGMSDSNLMVITDSKENYHFIWLRRDFF